jgi:hypothetical protein
MHYATLRAADRLPDDTSRAPPQGSSTVADETDFLDLYARLRLEPGCTLADFKQAYRRHVAQWHPDRRAGGRADALAAARLQRLTKQYGAAMEFHRRHGRLPGAPMPARVSVVVPEPAIAVEDGAPAAAVIEAGETIPARVLPARWLLLVAVIGVAVLVWSLVPAGDPGTDDETDPVAPRAVAARAGTTTATIALGMSEDDILAIEGEPTQRSDERWEYGPSWIRFENHAVADWYSSPLRGLHSASARAHR